MKVGSLVYIASGTHKGFEGKIVALSDPKQDVKDQLKFMGDEIND